MVLSRFGVCLLIRSVTAAKSALLVIYTNLVQPRFSILNLKTHQSLTTLPFDSTEISVFNFGILKSVFIMGPWAHLLEGLPVHA